MSAELTKNALAVLEARYLRRGRDGTIVETPAQLFERVARAVADAELLYGPAAKARRCEERFHQMMSSLEFLPNSPTLMNAGTTSQQLSACFVLPIEDNIESIFGTLRDMALVQRTGGGTGFSFSHLRPANDFIASTGGMASGPVSFMKIFDCATENIKQGGKRRGANMGVLRMDHPEIEQFINAKLDENTLSNFNISVGVTDRFMNAAKQGVDLPLLHPSDGRIIGSRNAGWLFDAMCQAAWQSGDPGLVFLDAIARGNPTPSLGDIECTNPCGEVPLLPYEACNLGSLNLARMLSVVDKVPTIDWEKLRRLVHDAVRFLDDVISVNSFPLNLIEKVTLGNRKIGLGVMGFAELCILLGISYGSDDGLQLADKVMRFIAYEALGASVLLAEERGPFPNWKQSKYYDTLRLRNATLTSIAPTGTIGIIAGTTSGIEPLFALAYRRTNVLNQQTLIEFNPLFLGYLEQRKLARKDLLDAVAHYGTLQNDANVPKDMRKLFNTALEITPEYHVRMQATFQKHVDNAVSKTVNLAATASPDDVGKVYRLAHELGCKGVTVFRYGSKDEGLLQLGIGETAYEREHFAKCDPGACRL